MVPGTRTSLGVFALLAHYLRHRAEVDSYLSEGVRDKLLARLES